MFLANTARKYFASLLIFIQSSNLLLNNKPTSKWNVNSKMIKNNTILSYLFLEIRQLRKNFALSFTIWNSVYN